MMAACEFDSALVLGAGSWGTALASVLGQRGLRVQLWGRDAELMAQIQAERCNARYAPMVRLPETVTATADWGQLQPAPLLVVVTPSLHLAAVVERAAQLPWVEQVRVAVSCTKGIEAGSAISSEQCR